MEFGRFSDKAVGTAVGLVNTLQPFSERRDELQDVADLKAFLTRFGYERDAATAGEADLNSVRALRSQLRAVFHLQDEDERVKVLNTIASQAQVVPEMTNHDGTGWHVHFGPADLPLHRRLAGETSMALMLASCEEGCYRLGTCQSNSCDDAFVDTTRNHSQRYCCGTCATRQRVSALRARRRIRSA